MNISPPTGIYDALRIPHDPTLEGARFFNAGEHLRIWSDLRSVVRSLEAKVANLQSSFEQRIKGLEALCGCTFEHDPVREARRFLNSLQEARTTKGVLKRHHRALEESKDSLLEPRMSEARGMSVTGSRADRRRKRS